MNDLVTSQKNDLEIRKPLPLDQHPAAVYLASLGQGSRTSMKQALEKIVEILTNGRCNVLTLDWSLLRYQHTQAIRTALAEKYRPNTVNKMLAALKGVIREAWRLGQIDAETFHRAVDLKQVKGQSLPIGRALSGGEIKVLFEACANEKGPSGLRDASLLAVLYGGGLRRSEVAALDLGDFNQESGELIVRGGKGRKDRIAYATDGARDALIAWIHLRGDDPGPLFYCVNKGGRIIKRRMTSQAIFYRLRELGKKSGVAAFSPHDLRRTFISDLLDITNDLVTVQNLAGHSTSVTTSRYDRRGERAKKKASEMLHVPFVNPKI